MSRQLLSDFLLAKNQAKTSIGQTNLNKSDLLPSQHAHSYLNHYPNQNNSFNNGYQKSTTEQKSKIFQTDTDAIDARNINNFVNQSNKYWRQEREMLSQNKKLSQSFQSENIDSSRGFTNTTNKTNPFDSNTNNGVQDLIKGHDQSGFQARLANDYVSNNNSNYSIGNDNENSRGNNCNITNYSYLDYQLNASQQEYVKTSNDKKNKFKQQSAQIPNQLITKAVNLENILSNIDSDQSQKPSYEINLPHNQQYIPSNMSQTGNNIPVKQPLVARQFSVQNNAKYEDNSSKRSNSIDSGFINLETNSIAKQNLFQLRISSQEIKTKGNYDQNLFKQSSEVGSSAIQSIKYKSECNIEDLSSQSNQFSIKNNSLRNVEDNSNKNEGEVNTINKTTTTTTTTKQQILSFNSSMKNADASFVFSYVRKQATCFPKDIKLDENYLEVLELSQNKFKIFPEEIQNFKCLKRIKIDNNFIRIIPQWLFNAINLVEFSISNNLIQEIPTNIINQQNLVSLNISQNRISQIPEQLLFLKSLQSLNISNNEFTSLPVTLKNLLDGNLMELNLDWFKYCNPPLNQAQQNTESKYSTIQSKYVSNSNNTNTSQMNSINVSHHFNSIGNMSPRSSAVHNSINYQQNLMRNVASNGGEIITPLKKFSQLLLRAEQQQLTNQYQQKQGNQKQIFSQVPKGVGYSYTFKQFVTEMSSNGFLVNIRNFKGQTLMHTAAANEDIGVIESLNQMDSTLKNERDQNEHSPLSLSINEEKYFSAKKLLQLGCDVNTGGSIYGSALNIATMKGQIYLIQDIVSKNVNPNVADIDGNTCLHYIMTIFSRDNLNSISIAQILLDIGCNPNLKNNDGWTPLHLAVRRQQYSAVYFAIDHNKNCILEEQRKQLQNEQRKYKQTSKDKSYDLTKYDEIPFCKLPFKIGQNTDRNDKAATQNQIEKQQFDFSLKGGNDKWSCLHISCYNNDLKMAKMLLQLKETDFFSLNKKNQTPLFLSSKGNVLNKLMKLYQKQIIFNDLELNIATQKPIEATNKDYNHIKQINVQDNIKDKTSIIQTDSSQASECQSEAQALKMNPSYNRADQTVKTSQSQNNRYGNALECNLIDQPNLPDYTNVAKIMANITSPQEHTLPFHIQRKLFHLQMKSKKTTNQDILNFDDDEDDDQNYEDIAEFPGQTYDDFNINDIDENNQIKEIMKSREGNILDNSKKRSNSFRQTNNYVDQSPAQNNKRVNSEAAVDNYCKNPKQNQYYMQPIQKKSLPPNSSSPFMTSNKKPTINSSSIIQRQLDQFSSRLCNVEEVHYSEEQNEIQMIKPETGYATSRETTNNYLTNHIYTNQIGRIFNSDSKQAHKNAQENSLNIIKNNQQLHHHHHQVQNSNDMAISQSYSHQEGIKGSTEKNSKQSIKEQKKLSHNILRYSHDDKEGNVFCIPKLYSGDNRQAIIFQTIQNIFSLFVSGTIQYKKSLIETIQCVADKYKQIVIILKLFIESYSQMETILQQNANYLPRLNASQFSLQHIKRHTQLLLQDLLPSINITPINYRTLMRFVEDNNEEFQENLLLQRQSKDKTLSLQKNNNNMPQPNGDSTNRSFLVQSPTNSQQQDNLQFYNLSEKFLLLAQQQKEISPSSKANTKQETRTKDESQKNTPQKNLSEINKDEIIEEKEQIIDQQDICSNSNTIVKEYLISSLLKIDLSPEFDLTILKKLQSSDQNILIQFESYQAECLISIKTDQIKSTNINLPNSDIQTNQQINMNSNLNINNFTNENIDLKKLNTESCINDFLKPSNPIFKPPIYAKRTSVLNNQKNPSGNDNTKAGVRTRGNIYPFSNNNLNSSAPDQHNQSSFTVGSTMNTSSAAQSNYKESNNHYNNNNNNINTNNTVNTTLNTYQQESNLTNAQIQNIKLENTNPNNVINENKIFQYPKIKNIYNGYFNNQVLQEGKQQNQAIFHKPISYMDITNKSPTITKPCPPSNYNEDNIINQFDKNTSSFQNQNISTYKQNQIFQSQNKSTLQNQNPLTQTIKNRDTFNLNENLENSFLNDEAIIANKCLNSQVNKFQKYK